MEINALISLETEAWTEILSRGLEDQTISVNSVDAIPLNRDTTRFLISLDGQSDEISFLGKRTNAREASFYCEASSSLSFLTSPCWYSYINGVEGYVVLDDSPNDRTPEQWTEMDVERVIGNMANLHLAYWNQLEKLQAFRWLPYSIMPVVDEPAGNKKKKKNSKDKIETSTLYDGTQPVLEGSGPLSHHAVKNGGPLAPVFQDAAIGLQLLRQLGGWPGIIEDKHLVAMAELLDDPVPMLYPLRRLPSTMLHGNLFPHNWRMSMFGDCTLVDWQQLSIGPSVCDLVNFTERFELLYTQDKGWYTRESWPVSPETMVDTYILHLYDAQWPLLDTRSIRQAIPAARCLYVISQWLPQFSQWCRSYTSATWQELIRMDDQELIDVGLSNMAGMRPYLEGLFSRFLSAYKLL